MTWMWLSAIIVLVGAELNSEIERQALHPTATEEVVTLRTPGVRHVRAAAE